MKKLMNPFRRRAKRRLMGVVASAFILALGTSAVVYLRGGETKVSASRSRLSVQGSQIRPLTQEEAQKLAAGIKQLVNKSTDGLVSVKHPDGTVSMNLQGRFQNVALAKKNDDGTISQACVDTPESAARFFDIDPQLVQDQSTPKRSPTNKRNP